MRRVHFHTNTLCYLTLFNKAQQCFKYNMLQTFLTDSRQRWALRQSMTSPPSSAHWCAYWDSRSHLAAFFSISMVTGSPPSFMIRQQSLMHHEYNVWGCTCNQNHSLITGRELRSGVKCLVVTIVTGSLWLVRRYRWGQVNSKTISTIPSH